LHVQYRCGTLEAMKRLMTLLVALSAGCASVGPTQQIMVRSEPAGAAVTVECGDVKNDTHLRTPTRVTVHRGPDQCAILLVKEGYHPVVVPLRKARSAWHFGNVLAGVLTGRVPDTSNAPTHDRTPATIDVELEKAE
jgi:hypothetical protein